MDNKDRLFEIIALLGVVEYKLESLVNEANGETGHKMVSSLSICH